MLLDEDSNTYPFLGASNLAERIHALCEYLDIIASKEKDKYIMVREEKKRKGVFYTDTSIAKVIADRTIENCEEIILEPSFGDGAFLTTIVGVFERNGHKDKIADNIYGVEIREETISELQNKIPYLRNLIHSDFLNVKPFPVDLIIGNPPFVSIKHLSEIENKAVTSVLNERSYLMPKNGSLWLPFVLHSMSFLNKGGTLAFVLPFELTYVRYAKKLWQLLCEKFGDIRVVRIFEDVFPDVGVETVLLIASKFGEPSEKVTYEIYKDISSLIIGQTIKISQISLNQISNGDRPFTIEVLDRKIITNISYIYKRNVVRPISQVCKFKIGYVSADKNFFHPSKSLIEEYNLEKSDLIPAIVNSKVLKKSYGLFIDNTRVETSLFYPKNVTAGSAASRYIAYGEKLKVNQRYKCRMRNPWYITPDVVIPDFVLNVFGDNHILYVNSGQYAVSNSLLCGFLQSKIGVTNLLASWYNSLTLLSIELKVHYLGGGVLVMIPGEVDQINTVKESLFGSIPGDYCNKIEKAIIENKVEDAYRIGDELLIKFQIVTRTEIEAVREAIEVLRQWRIAKHRKMNS